MAVLSFPPNIDFRVLGPLAGLQALEQAIFNQVAEGLLLFSVDYTFTPADQGNGYCFVTCQMPEAYADTNYFIQCTLKNNNPGGGWLCLGYIGGSPDPAHGLAPTPSSFVAVLLNIQGNGIVSGNSVTLFCLTNSFAIPNQ